VHIYLHSVYCDDFCEASVSTNCGSVIGNQQLVWIPELEFFSKDKMGMVTDEKTHLKLEDEAG
jgi:hypothetical protein